MSREEIKRQFIESYFKQPYSIEKLPADASFRSYERIFCNDKSYILMDAPPEKEEVKPFINVGEFLYKNNFSAPCIIEQDSHQGLVLLEDLGHSSYTKILGEGQGISEELLYRKAIDVLVKLHELDDIVEVPHYSIQILIDEACLILDWYFKALNGEELAQHFKEEYIAIWTKLLNSLNFRGSCLALRDYHADNLMWLEDRVGHKKVGLLDFQDAVIGSVAYDLVSLLEDARRDVNKDLAQAMVNYYLETTGHNRREFLADYAILGAQRNCKIIGFCARKSLRDDDARYLKLLPRVWGHVRENLSNPLLLPLKQWFDKVSVLALHTK